ncbi:hypothetical protein CVT24_001654 [Panaeolus cyanescens]|uniref:RRM domain-containing protein n=1 Tax=Panaeolus cyanescens TaxID=181874 RepID=A0A409VSX9_9AGAR|nr:hypothetical protein CVT24_001654 [Panaeolus cyanescens]
MSRGRSRSPRPDRDVDMDVDTRSPDDKPDAKVVIVTNLTRNVVESHLKTIFGFYGQINKIDVPVFGKSGQNRGKAALEFSDASAAHKAASHMNGGQLDGAVLKVELSDLPIRSPSRSPARPPRGPARGHHPQDTEEEEAEAEILTEQIHIVEEEVSGDEAEDVIHTAQCVRGLVHAPGHPFDGETELLHHEGAPQVIPEEDTVAGDQGATLSVQAALAPGPSRVLAPHVHVLAHPALVLVHAPCHTPQTLAIAAAAPEVALGLLAPVVGVIVVMILGTAGQGLQHPGLKWWLTPTYLKIACLSELILALPCIIA